MREWLENECICSEHRTKCHENRYKIYKSNIFIDEYKKCISNASCDHSFPINTSVVTKQRESSASISRYTPQESKEP